MKWASSVSDDTSLENAIAETARVVARELGAAAPDRPNLALVFASEHHRSGFARVPELIARELGNDPIVIGCSAGGVIGGGREVEQRPGVSLTAAALPGVDVVPFHLETGSVPSADAGAQAWERTVGVTAAKRPHFVLLPDPFTFDAETFVRGLDTVFPESRKIGGIASGGREPGTNALFLGRQTFRSGVVGVALHGDVEVDTIVAQGCRPIGLPGFVTRCRENVLFEMDGRPPLAVLEELHAELEPRDQELFRHSLFLGIVMKEDRQEYGRGDFLIRNLIGADRDSGAIAVGTAFHEGMVIQFHLRDAATSAEDLDQLLARYRDRAGETPPSGSLLFSCLGRGSFLYGRPDHDTDLVRQHLGEIPLGGFFCNGEIGPVGGTTFLHGYTSSFGLFRPRPRTLN